MPAQAHDKRTIIESFLAWLRQEGRWRDDETIAAFAAQATEQGARAFHGYDEASIVALLGGRAKVAQDETKDLVHDN
jgi:hypothetical protein